MVIQGASSAENRSQYRTEGSLTESLPHHENFSKDLMEEERRGDAGLYQLWYV